MLRSGAAERLATRLMDVDPSGQVLFRSTDILWNLLENGGSQQVVDQLSSLTCIGYVALTCRIKRLYFLFPRSFMLLFM